MFDTWAVPDPTGTAGATQRPAADSDPGSSTRPRARNAHRRTSATPRQRPFHGPRRATTMPRRAASPPLVASEERVGYDGAPEGDLTKVADHGPAGGEGAAAEQRGLQTAAGPLYSPAAVTIALTDLEQAIDALAAADDTELADAELCASVLELERLSRRLTAQQARLLGAVDRRRAYREEACVSTASWLRWRARLDPATAQRRTRAAVRLPELPETEAAFQAGRITDRHVEAITEADSAWRHDTLTAVEPELIDIACNESPRSLRLAVKRVRELTDPDGSEPPADPRAPIRPDPRRELFASKTFEGLVVANMVMDQLDGELLLTLLDALDEPDPADTPPAQRRTPPQRRADAFAKAVRLALGCADLPEVQGRKPHASLIIDLQTLLGHDDLAALAPQLRHTGEVDTATARVLLADCAVTPILTLGPWRPVSVGRTQRTLPDWLRPVLEAVHPHCRGPGCDRKFSWTQAHHTHPWEDGGETDVNRTVPLCQAHHTLVTSGGWRVDFDPETGICTWVGPGGGPVILTYPPRCQRDR